METTRRDVIRGAAVGAVVAIGVALWFQSAPVGMIVGLVFGMFAGNWRKRGTKWLALGTLVAVIGFFFWFAQVFRASFLKTYRVSAMGDAMFLIRVEDSVHAARKTFTRDLAALYRGSYSDGSHVKISEADSGHWIASFGDSAAIGTCMLRADRWAGPGGVRSQESFDQILDGAVCTDKATAKWWRTRKR